MRRFAAIALVVVLSACDRRPAKVGPGCVLGPPPAGQVFVPTAEPSKSVDAWIAELLVHDMNRTRQAQYNLLLKKDEAIPKLCAMLVDPDESRRRAAIEALRSMDAAAAPAAPALARAAMDGTQETAWQITPILVRNLGDAGETALIEALHEPDTKKALLLFSSIDNTDQTGTQDFAVWILERALRTHADAAVRLQAVAVLSKLVRDRSLAVATVVHALLEDADPGVRAACARLLGTLSSDDDDVREMALPVLREATKDREAVVARAASAALRQAQPEERLKAQFEEARVEEEAALLEKQNEREKAAALYGFLLEQFPDSEHAESWKQALVRMKSHDK